MKTIYSLLLTLALLLPTAVLAQDVPGTVKFPTAADTADSLIRASNSARSTLTGSLSSGATTITVVAAASFPSSGAAMIDNEVIFYTAKTSTQLTGVTRGADSTTAASHSSGAAVRGVITAAHHNTLAAAIIATQNRLLNLGSDDLPATLTGKSLTGATLTTPSVSSPAITGGTASGISLTGGTATGLTCIGCTGLGTPSSAGTASTGDVTIASDTEVNASGDIIAMTGGVERARFTAGGAVKLDGQNFYKTFNAKTYNVVGDSSTNDTTNLQAALTAASGAGALDVILPPGQYQLTGQISVPANVRLVGFSSGTHPRPESGNWTPSRNVDYTKGTVIRCTADAGNEGGTPCITLGQNAALEGVSIYYPNQSPTAGTPTGYPWAISFAGMDARVERIELVNPYKGIYVGNFSHRATVRDVVGQPIKTGIEVDKNLDVTRLEDIHFVPNWSYASGDTNGLGGTDNGPFTWSKANGTAFLLKRADSLIVSNVFALGYNSGVRFERSAGSEDNGSANGTTYGDFTNISMDVCNSCIDIADISATQGVSFTNVSLVAYHGTNPTGIRVRPTNAGKAQFRNVKVWGGATNSFNIEGSGLISIVGSQSAATTGWTAELGGTGVVVLRDAAMASTNHHVRVAATVTNAYVSDIVTGHSGFGPDISNLGSAGKLVTNHAVWSTPTLGNSWVNYDANWEPASYAWLNSYEVRIKGYIKSGTLNTTIFSLPAGLCPLKLRRFVVYSTAAGVNTPASIQINPDCTVVQTEGGNQILSLDINYTLP